MDDLLPAVIGDDGCRLAGLVASGARVTADEFAALEAAADTHGVLPLLASRSEGERARAVLRDAAAFDAARTAVLIGTLQSLHEAGVRVIVLKGVHLALTRYPAPHLRPRSDADLFIAESSRAAARETLEAIGFTLIPHVRGDLILTQMHFTRESNGLPHPLDVHWQALNPHAFRDLLRFDDAWQRSGPIPALGPSARGLCDADAMLLATTHPVAHHSGGPRLIWIVDVDVIASAMTAATWDEFVRRACAARVARVVLASLTAARLLLHSAVPDEVLEALSKDDADQHATAAYLLPATRAARLWSEVRGLSGWRARAQYLRQHLVPDPAYMRATYGGSTLMLPWHYIARVAGGAARWIRE